VKILQRLTNSFVITAALLAVIISSLCFSVGEGLRLTPFPKGALTRANDVLPVVDVKGQGSDSLCKYGPLDVPTQIQKRGKRNALDLAAGLRATTLPVVTASVRFPPYEADDFQRLLLVTRPSGRAPPSAIVVSA
jgi:hypothetical protein